MDAVHHSNANMIQRYKRLGLGVVAACIAWPTVFMPFDYALIAQFAGFMGIYAADAQITSQGFGKYKEPDIRCCVAGISNKSCLSS